MTATWNTDAALASLASFLVVAAMAFFMPQLTRPDVYFSVTVPKELRRTAAGREALRRYRWWIVLHTAIGGLGVVLGERLHVPALFQLGTTWQVAGSLHAFLVARRLVLPHAVAPSTQREAGLAPRPGLPGGLVAQLGPFVILAATAVYLAVHGAAAVPYRALMASALLCGVAAAVAWATLHGSRRIRAVGPAAASERRFLSVVLTMLLAVEYLIAFQGAMLALLPLFPDGPRAWMVIVMLAHVGFAIATVVIAVWLGQGGARTPALASLDAAPVGDRTPDACWKWGLFYVNRDDPAIIVEKRFGIGFTFNFGNRWAWLLLALLLIVPIVATGAVAA